MPPAAVRPADGAIRLAVELELPPGYEINPLAPMQYRLEEADAAKPAGKLLRRESFSKPTTLEKPARKFEVRLPVTAPKAATPSASS